MKAIQIRAFGGSENLYMDDFEDPIPGKNEILVKVAVTALNRADTLQRMGMYPPPTGASPILGLEIAGTVDTVGQSVKNWKKGDKVFGLLSGGGYAQYAVIHQDIAMAIPEELSFEQAAAIPEVFLTAYQAICYLAQFKKGESILIHAGASGVGTAAIQMAKNLGADKVIVTASKGKHSLCKTLGADITIDYKSENFETVVKEVTDGKGVDIIIDFLGASYFQKNINSTNFDGRIIMLAFMGGTKIKEANLSNILRKRIRIMGSTLRARNLEYKIQLTKDFQSMFMTKFRSGELTPVIDTIYDWKDVVEAHNRMEANKNKGKIVLKVS